LESKKEKQENGGEALFEELIVKISPKWMKNIKPSNLRPNKHSESQGGTK
jgi:hypothetical protein